MYIIIRSCQELLHGSCPKTERENVQYTIGSLGRELNKTSV